VRALLHAGGAGLVDGGFCYGGVCYKGVPFAVAGEVEEGIVDGFYGSVDDGVAGDGECWVRDGWSWAWVCGCDVQESGVVFGHVGQFSSRLGLVRYLRGGLCDRLPI
jgi:hypothetical protein